MNKFLILSVSLAVFVMSLFVGTAYVNAQAVQDGTTLQSPSTDTNTGTTTNNTNATSGLDWRWLLPLLAVPVILLFWSRGSDENEMERRYRAPSSGLAGMKGGRRERELDERDRDYEDIEE